MPYGTNFRAPKVDVHKFSMIPRAEIPRSTFKMQSQHKTTIQASDLVPIFVQEVLPGDTWSLRQSAFVRLSTPLYPILDNMDIEFWYFFIPHRIVWQYGPGLPGSWEQFMGEQPQAPTDSISYSIPQITLTAVQANTAFTIYDYMGIPTGNITGANLTINALPFRAYNMVVNEWFRDQNLDTALGYGAANTVYDLGNGPDPQSNYTIFQVRKRHDYFTSGLPWTQKGAAGAVTLPLGTAAIVKTQTTEGFTTGSSGIWFRQTTGSQPAQPQMVGFTGAGPTGIASTTTAATTQGTQVYPTNLYADLSTATAATINQIRLAFQTQKLLERDARGGTRYTELVRSHFGVMSPDARLQRPEMLTLGRTPVNIAPVPQTTQTGLTGGTSPLGTLAAVGTAAKSGLSFRQSFTEHGTILGLCAVRRDPVYQQGLRRMWTRLTRYDFYFPVFAMLGEQSIRNDELYCVGTTAQDQGTFAFQERWAEYRYQPSIVSGAFRSLYATPLDAWHLAQKFTALPALNSTFITDDLSATLARNLAAGGAAAHQQFLCDFFFDCTVARPMPMYSVPGLIDHF